MSVEIFLSDGNSVLMKGLAAKLLKEKNLKVIPAWENSFSTPEYVMEHCPDIFIYDIDSNGEKNGFPLLREIVKAHGDRVRSVALSDCAEPETYGAFFHLGGWAYELKSCSDKEITAAIQQVCLGKHFLCSSLGGDFAWSCFRDNPPLHHDLLKTLTPTEKRVIALVKKGYTVKEVAIELKMKVRTAQTHIDNIRNKLDIHSLPILQKRLLYTKIE